MSRSRIIILSELHWVSHLDAAELQVQSLPRRIYKKRKERTDKQSNYQKKNNKRLINN